MLASDLLKLATALKDGTLSSLDFDKLTDIVPGSKPVLGFETVEIDLTATATDIVVVPTIAGYYFVPVIARWVVTAAAGVATTPPTTKAGNNVTHDRLIASGANPTNATHALGVGAFGSATVITTGAQDTLATPITAEVTAAATGTGGFIYKVKLVALGYLKAA